MMTKSLRRQQPLWDGPFSEEPRGTSEVCQEAEKEEVPGGSCPGQYELPQGAKELQDLIEAKGLNFAQGNIFKAIYRMGRCAHSDIMRDLQKCKWFIDREIVRVEREGDF